MQLKALKKAGCKRFFAKKFQESAGTVRNSNKCWIISGKAIRVIVWRLDRLARSTRHLLETMETIREAGARFQSLSEPWADTTTHAGKMIMTVFAGIAEFERELLLERTHAGRIAAKTRGVRFGRPSKLNSEQLKLAQRLIEEGKAAHEIADTFNVHVATIYRLSAAMDAAYPKVSSP